ncbi:MAG: ADP-ribosylglycohydrolase family protein [Chloroflexota bacterium]
MVYKLSKKELKNKILGAWVGKSYGAMMGEPMEFHAQGEIYEGLLDIQPEAPTTWLYYEDDLYTNMAFLEIMRDKGLNASQDDFADVFRKSDFMLWHANGQARQNLLEGVPPGLSGHPYYSPHADDIDFQIECDFIGIVSPGLSEAALKIAAKVGHLMNYGDGYYAGAFLSALYAYAYVETDRVKMIQLALKAIPAESDYAKIIIDLLGWYAEEPNDWRATWQKLEDKWNHDLCPWAKSDPLPLTPDVLTDSFNIQGHFNGAYILIGLLYGKGDYLKAISICTRCGQDTDSNVANCGGIMGVILGNESLPEAVHAELAPYMDRDYHFTTLSINSATELSYQLALENVEVNGGTVTENEISIPVQVAKHSGPCEVSFPQFAFGDIYTITPTLSPELTWHGDWKHPFLVNRWTATVEGEQENKVDRDFMSSDQAGDYLEVPFRGNCIYVQGNLHENFGILEAYVDGVLLQTRDMSIRPIWNGHKQATAVWITGLADGEHTLRVVVTGRKNELATGCEIQLGRVVSYHGQIPLPSQNLSF